MSWFITTRASRRTAQKYARTTPILESRSNSLTLSQSSSGSRRSTEAKPDGSAYAAPFHKLYVSDERGKAEAIVDVQQDKIIKTLHFDSETGMPQYDPIARKVYVNLQDQNVFAVIDRRRMRLSGATALENAKVITEWPLTLSTGEPS